MEEIRLLYYIFPDGVELDPEEARRHYLTTPDSREAAFRSFQRRAREIAESLNGMSESGARAKLGRLEGTPLHGEVVAILTGAEDE